MSKLLNLFVVTVVLFCGLQVLAHDHSHVKHNMVLFGEETLFVSHIVYKVPHNYQVILKITLDSAVKEAYLNEFKKNPQDQFIFLLDEMHIKDITSYTAISGTIFRIGANGQKMTIAEKVILTKDAFAIVYFNELPLSLE